jgi:hypothetical protein
VASWLSWLSCWVASFEECCCRIARAFSEEVPDLDRTGAFRSDSERTTRVIASYPLMLAPLGQAK